MKKKICFISSSRADFGIMRNLISLVNNQKYFDVSLILTGSHLSKKFGLTKNEVSKYFIGKKYFIKTSDKINKNKDIDMLIGSDKTIRQLKVKMNNFFKFNYDNDFYISFFFL